MRRSGIIIVLLVVALAAGLGGWWFLLRFGSLGFRPGPSPIVSTSPTPAGSPNLWDLVSCEKIAAKDRADCTKIGFYKWSSDAIKAAQKAGDPAACDKLSDAYFRDTCRMYYVFSDQRTDLCARIENTQTQAGCLAQAAVQKNDLAGCSALPAGANRQYCLNQVVRSHLAEGVAYCAGFPSLQDVCAEMYWSIRAADTGEYKFCRNITNPDGAQRCLALLPPDTDGDGLSDYAEEIVYRTDPKIIDTDRDGLSDYEEVKVYRTDPADVDTDGDTYADGVEVRNGFDPKGPGKLKR